MREEEVSLVRQQIFDGHFFHAEDYGSFGHVLRNFSASIDEHIIAEAPDGGGLDQNFNASLNNLLYFDWCKRAAALPLVLAFAQDTNRAYRVCFDHFVTVSCDKKVYVSSILFES